MRYEFVGSPQDLTRIEQVGRVGDQFCNLYRRIYAFLPFGQGR